jgi:hypothetical protein
MSRAVPERALQRKQDFAAPIQREALKRDRGVGDVAAEPFEPIPMAGRTSHSGVQGEAVVVHGEGLQGLRVRKRRIQDRGRTAAADLVKAQSAVLEGGRSSREAVLVSTLRPHFYRYVLLPACRKQPIIKRSDVGQNPRASINTAKISAFKFFLIDELDGC